MAVAECVYCEEEKEVKIWKETGELVCFECRLQLLEQEYEQQSVRSNKSTDHE